MRKLEELDKWTAKQWIWLATVQNPNFIHCCRSWKGLVIIHTYAF